MKIDFRKILVKDIEGNESTFDISKELGNDIYNKTADIGELELARELYLKGEIELDAIKVEILKKYIDEGYKAFVKEALNPILDKVINLKK
ncbi:MAG: hypothetical protein GX912_10515 [Gammaproteobacteria bacterium]|nr:hypothetical protein [Gammaproteobacteria bacterium]